MDLETYAERHPQFASEEIESHLLEWLTRAEFTTFLDVGCGSGRLIAALCRRGLLDETVARGVDLSRRQVERFRAQLPEIGVAVDDAERLRTVDDQTIEFLTSTQVLEHVDDAQMLTAVGRVLSPSGTAYISTVFKRRWARFFWRTENGEWALDPTHLREYTVDDQLLGLLDATGLILVDSRKTPVSFPMLDFVLRRLAIRPERIFASPLGRMARRVRVRVPGYFIWSLVLQRLD